MVWLWKKSRSIRIDPLYGTILWASLVAQLVKNPSARQETPVWFLDREDTLEEGQATHSRILAWRIPWTEEPGRLQSMGSQGAGHNSAWHVHFFTLRVVLRLKISRGKWLEMFTLISNHMQKQISENFQRPIMKQVPKVLKCTYAVAYHFSF